MKITIVTRLFTKRYVNIYSSHSLKVSFIKKLTFDYGIALGHNRNMLRYPYYFAR